MQREQEVNLSIPTDSNAASGTPELAVKATAAAAKPAVAKTSAAKPAASAARAEVAAKTSAAGEKSVKQQRAVKPTEVKPLSSVEKELVAALEANDASKAMEIKKRVDGSGREQTVVLLTNVVNHLQQQQRLNGRGEHLLSIGRDLRKEWIVLARSLSKSLSILRLSSKGSW